MRRWQTHSTALQPPKPGASACPTLPGLSAVVRSCVLLSGCPYVAGCCCLPFAHCPDHGAALRSAARPERLAARAARAPPQQAAGGDVCRLYRPHSGNRPVWRSDFCADPLCRAGHPGGQRRQLTDQLHVLFGRNLLIPGLWRPDSDRLDSPAGRHRSAQRAAADWLVSVFCLHCHGAFLARRFERKLEPEPGFMAPWPRPPQARASNPGKSSMRSNRWAAPAWRKAAPCSGSGQ